MDLNGKVALVTGAGVRLGRAMALALADAGSDVVVHYNSSEGPAREVAELVESKGRRAATVQGDLLDPVNASSAIVSESVSQLGRLDVLINCAAIFEESDLLSTTEDQWDRHHTINLKAPFFLTQAFVRELSDEQRGHVINLVDWRGTRPDGEFAAYTPTKAGLVAVTRNLAQSLGPQVQVNAIAPGAILPGEVESQENFDERARDIPLKRTGDPEFITDAMLYLLRSDFVTGEVIHVTGGEHL